MDRLPPESSYGLAPAQVNAVPDRRTTLREEVRARPAGERLLLAVCCHCQRVRDAHEEWREITAGGLAALRRRPEPALLSHGICADCFRLHYPSYSPPSSELRT